MARERAGPDLAWTTWLAAAVGGAVVIAGVVVVLATRGQGGRGSRPADEGERLPTGSAIVEVTTRPPGARVFEDGQDRGTTPVALPVPPGREVVLDLVRPGYRSARRVVTASPGEPVVVDVELVPAPAAPEPTTPAPPAE